MNQTIGESQRDSVSKPRVARNELPWEQRAREIQPQRGCGPGGTADFRSCCQCIRQRRTKLSIYLTLSALFANANCSKSGCKQGSVPHNHIFLVDALPLFMALSLLLLSVTI